MSEAQGEFAGGVFSTALEGGRSGATISFGAHAVLATTPDGQLFSVPFAELDISTGGASGKMWFCRSADRSITIFSEQSGFLEALRTAGQAELGNKLLAVQEAAQGASRRGMLMSLGIVAAISLCLAAAVLGVRQLGRLSVKALPHSIDVQLGKLALENMDAGGPTSNDKVLEAAVKSALTRLDKAQASDFKFQARVVESSVANAFALPGGPIVVYTGLLREAESPEQLAAVLAHEMAHVTRRHGMQRIAQSLGVVAAIQLLFGDVSGVMAIALELLRDGAINSYSRDQEREADFDGLERLRRAHFDPGALADFFALLQKRGGELPSALSWLGTHPELQQRVRDVRAKVAKLPPGKRLPLAIDWADVRRRAGKELPPIP